MHSLERFSESCEAITAESPSGGAWLRFARHHASDGGFGLPTTLMEPHVRRLADELCRSVGVVAELTRYEALALLRCSAYGDLVDSVLREMVLDPDAQVVYPLTSVLSEQPTPALLHWAGAMLRHESILVAQGASYALQSMLVIGGLRVEDWESLVPHFTSAWHDAERGRDAANGADRPVRRAPPDGAVADPQHVPGRGRAASRTAGLVPQQAQRPLRVRPLDRRRRVRAAGPPRGAPPGAAALRGHVRPPRGAHVDLGAVRRRLPVCPRPGAAARRGTRCTDRTRRAGPPR